MDQSGSTSWIGNTVGVIFILLIVAVLVLPNFIKSPPGTREDEVKASMHTIQIAVERYYFDHGEYPAYLLGGSTEGWEQWHVRWDGYGDWQMADGRIASNNLVKDPLIELGYLSDYPKNPFVDSRRGQAFQTLVTSIGPAGSTTFDPRFGTDGSIMGMTLDDPDYFCGALQPDPSGWSEVELRRTLDRGDWMNVPDVFRDPGISGYYLSGGRTEPGSDRIINAFWPGTFFYRSLAGRETIGTELHGRFGPSTGIRESPQAYILGGLGGERTAGEDVIRLQPFNPDGEILQWQFPGDHADDVVYCGYRYPREPESSGGLPAVFGGGDAWTGPQYPPFNPETGSVIFGAPDGIPDGVILVLTSYKVPSEWQG